MCVIKKTLNLIVRWRLRCRMISLRIFNFKYNIKYISIPPFLKYTGRKQITGKFSTEI